jgi:hypothetical protein
VEARAIDVPIAQPVGIDYHPTTARVRNELWPDGVRRAAADFIESIDRGRTMISQRFVRATRLWSDFTSAMGPAALIDPQPRIPISASDLAQ